MRLFKRKQAAPPWRTGPNSTFTRASTAMLNGVQFASGVPRIDGGKILVEEGTTNLLPTGSEDFVTEWTAYGGETITVTDYPVTLPNGATVVAKRIRGAGNGNSLLKYKVDVSMYSAGDVRTYQIWLQKLSSPSMRINTNMAGAIVVDDGNMLHRSTTAVGAETAMSMMLIVSTSETDQIDIVVYAPQIEAKPYATTYTPPGTTRAAESLAIPVGAVDLGGGVVDYSNAVLNPSAGTIEMDFVMSPSTTATSSLFVVGNVTDGFISTQYANGNVFGLVYKGANYVTAGAAVAVGVKARVALKYASGQLDCFINGVKMTGVAFPALSVLSGNIRFFIYYNDSGNLNGSISNLRISRIARSDTEMAYTGKLRADSYTTFFRKFWR